MKVWIWGTGNIAKRVYENGLGIKIRGFIETKKNKEVFLGYPVISAADIPIDFDLIIVANNYSDQIYEWCVSKGIDLGKVIFFVRRKKTDKLPAGLKDILGERNYTDFMKEYGEYKDTFVEADKKCYERLNKRRNFDIKDEYMMPIIGDKFASAGVVNNYFWQDLWAARHIISDGVKQHFDIGSRLDGFIAHLLASGIDVNMIDIRPFPERVDHLHTIVDDATLLKNVEDNSLYSLSALCSLEHFGLGRYGDTVDPEACFTCFEQIQRKLKNGGKFYLSVPVGKERVEFNAHRVFFASTITECFNQLQLKEFSCTAGGKIEYNVDIHKYDNDKNNGGYRYGLFYFRKGDEEKAVV